jgi:hypothetical protein
MPLRKQESALLVVSEGGQGRGGGAVPGGDVGDVDALAESGEEGDEEDGERGLHFVGSVRCLGC